MLAVVLGLGYVLKVCSQSSSCQRLCVNGFDEASTLNGAYLRQQADGEFSHWAHETRSGTLEQDVSGRWIFLDGDTPLAETLVAQSLSDVPAEDIFATPSGDTIVSFLCCDGADGAAANDDAATAADEDATMALIGAIGGALACLVVTGFGSMAMYSRLAAGKYQAGSAQPVADSKPLKRPPDMASEPEKRTRRTNGGVTAATKPDIERPTASQPPIRERPPPAELMAMPSQTTSERPPDSQVKGGGIAPQQQPCPPLRPHEPEQQDPGQHCTGEMGVIHVGDLQPLAHRARSAIVCPPVAASKQDAPLRQQRATMAKTMGAASNGRATDAWKQWAKVGVPADIRHETVHLQQPPISTPLADRIMRFASNDATDVAQFAGATWPPRELKTQDTGRAKLIAEIGEGSHGLRRLGKEHSVRPQTCVLPGTLFPFEAGDTVALGGFDAIEETWNGALGVLEAVDLQAGNCEVRLDDGRMKVVALERVVRKTA
mmetsp:Transcript_9240/g.21363  ORF Transcript_9240/g.21363 Transcript_9240/m.21363 type:complete len:489 (-) Transcript_9240:101-1567(-)